MLYLLHSGQKVLCDSISQHEAVRQVVDVLASAGKMRELQDLHGSAGLLPADLSCTRKHGRWCQAQAFLASSRLAFFCGIFMKSQIEGGGEEAESFGAFFKYSMSYTLLSSSCFLNLSFKTYSMAFTS